MKNFSSDLKIIVVGNSNTGKTSFVNKWTKNQFHEAYKATIVSEFGYKVFEYKDKVYRIQIWDLAGQDKSISMSKIFCKDSHGVIILSDITETESLSSTIKWKKSIDDYVTFFDGTPLPMLLIENKIDLVLSKEELETKHTSLEEFCNKNGFVQCSQTSVKEGINVNETMNKFLSFVIEKTEKLSIKKNAFDSVDEKPSIILSKENITVSKNKNNDSKCC